MPTVAILILPVAASEVLAIDDAAGELGTGVMPLSITATPIPVPFIPYRSNAIVAVTARQHSRASPGSGDRASNAGIAGQIRDRRRGQQIRSAAHRMQRTPMATATM